MYPYNNKRQFIPKKPVRSFRDLEVYQKTLECGVLICKDLQPKLAKLKYNFLENMINCCLSIPLYVAESHSLRFSDFKLAVATLEKAMMSCNKMIVYLEQIIGIYCSAADVAGPSGSKKRKASMALDRDLIEDLMRRYMDVRGKMFRLEKSWKKYREEDR